MSQWKKRRAAKQFGNKLQLITFLPYVLTFAACEKNKDDSSSQTCLQNSKISSGSVQIQNFPCLSKYLNSISLPSHFKHLNMNQLGDRVISPTSLSTACRVQMFNDDICIVLLLGCLVYSMVLFIQSKHPYGSFVYTYPTGLWSRRVYLCRGSVILSL